MHPIVTIELAEQRHADLLRAAEKHRLAAAFGPTRRSPFGRTVKAVAHGVTSLRGLTTSTLQSPAEPCCA